MGEGSAVSEPTQTIVRLFDRVAAKDLRGASELFALDAVFTEGRTALQGRSAIRQMLAEMWEAFPDLRVDVRALVGKGSTVMTEIELVGTHRGPFLGCEPTGRIIRWPGAAHYEVNGAGDKIVSESFFFDSAGLVEQLRQAP